MAMAYDYDIFYNTCGAFWSAEFIGIPNILLATTRLLCLIKVGRSSAVKRRTLSSSLVVAVTAHDNKLYVYATKYHW